MFRFGLADAAKRRRQGISPFALLALRQPVFEASHLRVWGRRRSIHLQPANLFVENVEPAINATERVGDGAADLGKSLLKVRNAGGERIDLRLAIRPGRGGIELALPCRNPVGAMPRSHAPIFPVTVGRAT